MNSKILFSIFLIFNSLKASWGAALGGAALGAAALGGAALLAGGLLGGNKEEDAARAKLNLEIAEKRVDRSNKESILNQAKANLNQDLSQLQTTMELLTDGTKDKIDDIYMLLTSGGGGTLRRIV